MKNSRYQKTKQGWVIRVPNPTDFDQKHPKTMPDFIIFRQKMVISVKNGLILSKNNQYFIECVILKDLCIFVF